MKRKFESFLPLMHKYEYEFIEKYLKPDDTLLEWGSGSSTLFFSDLVKEIISIEHDKDWIDTLAKLISVYDVKNIAQYYIPAHTPNPKPCRYAQFRDYVEFPKEKNFVFNKVLIDGRARKYCAKSIYDMIDYDTVVFIHDFNRPDYQMALKYYDVIEQLTIGQGIVALRKKESVPEDKNYY